MAQRKSNASKTTPAVRYLRYEMTSSGTPGTETSHFIDLARDLSRVNRRLYRAGRDYHVKKVTIVSSNTPNLGNRISVSAAPDSWVARGAWHRAYKAWCQMNKTASGQLSGNIQGTWADFKIFLSADMAGATLLNPKDNGGTDAAVALNWDVSTFVTPDGTATDDEFYGTLLGDHVGAAGSRTSVGLIRSYGESRATVQLTDPAVPSAASSDPLVNLFDYGTTIDDVIDLLEDQNDEPPYSQVQYPGAAVNMPKPLVCQDTTIVDGRATMGGFSALMGHLEFEIKSAIPEDVISVLIELAPGKYRGIKAEMI
jgi:hypothetical protein